MKKLKALIADDEQDALEILTLLLEENELVEIVGQISDPLKIESSIQKLKPDVLFLDILMPGYTGLELVKNLREYNMDLSIVMVTAHQEYIAEIINLQVFYCLYKPVDRQELFQLVEKLSKHKHMGELDDDKIKLPVKNGYVYLEHEEILMLAAEGNYTRIITIKGDEYVSSYNMGRLYKRLNVDKFFRINRGCILNSAYLRRIDKKQNLATITVNGDDQELVVSNAFITSFNKSHA